jgi:signal transduction histidine kinase
LPPAEGLPSLPVAAPAAEEGVRTGTPEDRVNLLLVDDQEANLTALAAVLEPFGETIVTARSGREALKHLLEREFAVVLLDVRMPDMDGFETAALIRDRDKNRHTPILFLTAISQSDEEVLKGYELGAVDYVFKPVRPEILRAKVSVFVELSKRRKHEREAREELARSNRDLSEFAQIVAHDLQSPLRGVTAHLERLAKSVAGLDDEAKRRVATAVAEAERMRAQIRDLLAYARVRDRPPEPRTTDSGVALTEALARLRVPLEEAGAQVERGELPLVHVDPGELSQLFQNLVDNAVKFRRGPEKPRVRVAAERDGEAWRFAVEDDGIGIAEPDRERIFGVFQRLHTLQEFPGTGIGLAICRRIVERNGGRIWVEARPGGGSVFRFTLQAPRENG